MRLSNSISRVLTGAAVLVLLSLASSTACAQSIWQQSTQRRAIFADSTARRIGDLLTIQIQESQVIQNNESTSLARESSLDAAITDFNLKPNTFNTLPSASTTSSTEFDGSATYNKNGTFQTSLTVMVIDVLPNGNLVIEGSRDITMDREHKRIRISGIVRPRDISTLNTVSSMKVAQARISYEGTGPLTQATNRNWFDTLLDFLWPF